MDVKLTMSADIKTLTQVLVILSENSDRIENPDNWVKQFVADFNAPEEPVKKSPTKKTLPAEKKETPASSAKAEIIAPAEPEEATPAHETPVKRMTLEAIREKVQAQINAGKRDEVKELLTSFKVNTLPDLPKETYVDFYAKVAAL